MADVREIVEGIQDQGEDEKVVYSLTTTPWGGTPTAVSIVVKDVTNNYVDVTASVMSGSSSIVGDVITLPTLQSLTRDRYYRVEIKFTSQGNILEAFFTVHAKR